MSLPIHEVLRQILEVQPVLHGAGTVSPEALAAIAKHAGRRRIRRSVETGCGATTLLLSHLSERHTVFALDAGGSLANVRRSPLLRQEAVTFIEGPSQRTLPLTQFDEPLQLALIDGPHAYPFPDLEYYFLYPHLEAGALLILDDIQIRSIHNLFEFLRRDAMFRLDEVVRATAFFTRTEAPAFDPLGDGWREQQYNQRTLLRYDWRSRLRSLLPRRVLRSLAASRSRAAQSGPGCSIGILSPRPGQFVAEAGMVKGQATVPPGAFLWVLAHRKDVEGWWPQGGGPVAVAAGAWSVAVNYGGPADAGFPFEITAVIVTGAVHQRWLQWAQEVTETGEFPPVALPMPPAVLAETYLTVRKETPQR